MTAQIIGNFSDALVTVISKDGKIEKKPIKDLTDEELILLNHNINKTLGYLSDVTITQ